MENITIPFLKKKNALELGAVFNREDRKWYIPDGIPEETKEKLRNLSMEEPRSLSIEKTEEPVLESAVTDTDSSGHTYMRNQYYGTETKTQTSQVLLDLSEISCTLEAALFVCKNGLPEDASDRVKLLKILSNRSTTQYPITYDGMVICSEEFANMYPPELLSDLCKRCITGSRHYVEEINASDLSEEEKALLFFALPI